MREHHRYRNQRKKTASVLAFILIASLIGTYLTSVWAVHDNVPSGSQIFELGNGASPTVNGTADILGSASQPGPDWQDIFNANGDVYNLSGGITAVFLKDPTAQKGATDNTTFAGSASSNKNNDPISGVDGWNWNTGNVPAKDDLVNSYAWAGINPANGHVIAYVGLERLAPEGDSHIDIEFFNDRVHLDEAPPCNDPGPDVTPCSFVGNRSDDDILVSMDFVNGGGIGEVSVRVFNEATGVYDLVETVVGEGCNGVAAANLTADSICAFNNGAPIDGGNWTNLDRQGKVITNIDTNGFTEFGIDLTEAAGGESPCISTIMAKTRSSQSFTAELMDFAGPFPFDICGGEIDIEPDAVNPVGAPHTFTVYVNATLGGVKFPAPDGTIVNVTLNGTAGASPTVLSETCSTGTVGGTCSVTFTSATPGTVTGHASANLTFGGTTLQLQTDGSASSSDDAVKRFVDARIGITPPFDTNSINETHVFTVNVTKNNGTGAGYVAATVGHVDVDLTDSDGATSVVDTSASTCDDAGDNLDANGRCTLVITSPTAGTVVAHASVTLVVDGVTLVRDTNGTAGNSGNATKLFVAGSIEWRKVDNAGRLLAGATFQVCRTHAFNSTTGSLDDIADECVSVLDNSPPDVNATGGAFKLVDLELGRYAINETVPPPGYAPDPDTEVLVINLTSPSATLATPFVDERPILKLSEFGYVNIPNGTPVDGVVSGNTTYTIKLKNFGNATANLTATLDVSGPVRFKSATGPGLTAPPPAPGDACPCSVTWDDVLVAPGAEVTMTVAIEYVDAADGSVVLAELDASYTTLYDAVAREPSGVPAAIAFTIQED